MSTVRRIVALVSGGRSKDLQAELDRAQRELVAAEAAFASAPEDAGGKLWSAVERARLQREQLAVKVRDAERREREEAERQAAAEAHRKRREMEEHLASSQFDAVRAAVAPLAARAAKIAAELIELDIERQKSVEAAHYAAGCALNLAQELGDPDAAKKAEWATKQYTSFQAASYAAFDEAVCAISNPTTAAAAARLVDPTWKEGLS